MRNIIIKSYHHTTIKHNNTHRIAQNVQYLILPHPNTLQIIPKGLNMNSPTWQRGGMKIISTATPKGVENE